MGVVLMTFSFVKEEKKALRIMKKSKWNILLNAHGCRAMSFPNEMKMRVSSYFSFKQWVDMIFQDRDQHNIKASLLSEDKCYYSLQNQ